ncbi:MAG: lipid IV(A) 3-deoxy-D-manno-octulosonic acid transferase [Pseudomonadota bacterium]
MRVLYTALLYLLTPFMLLRLIWRGFSLRDYWQRWPERFGFVPRAPAGVAVWVHAVSVGEALSALPLVNELIARYGHGHVWMTTMTPTGSARVHAALGGRVIHSYVPYDLPGAVGRFLDSARPRQVVFMETELWPNLLHAVKARGIPLTIANARLSPRSFKGYSRIRGFIGEVLACATRIAAQSELDAERFRALGAQRVDVMGNLKFELAVPDEQRARGVELRRQLGAARPVWVAASTHEGEEAVLLETHRRILQQLPQALLILVPRHPQRFDSVARLIEKSGLSFTRRSAPGSSAHAVLLGDSMGEMFSYLAAADLAFVGGSLVPVGGHNVLEPAALGLPVLFGPFMHNFLGAAQLLTEAGAGQESDVEDLSGDVLRLLNDPATCSRMGEAGRKAVEANRGALARLLKLLDVSASGG